MSINSSTSSSADATSPNTDATTMQQSLNTAPASAPVSAPTKRASRRANTAERRATHNAVERARRETLNGRFLDLAAILPNLAAVRRPSKSAIVNSSIALINNQRRARILAAREVRLLNAENNALRQELNEWRQRNSLPRVEEPIRSSELISLLNVQVEEELAEMELAMMNNGTNGRRSFDMPEGQFDDDEYNEDADEEALISPDSAHPYPQPMSMALPTVNHKLLASNTALQQQQQQQQAQLAAQQQQQQQLYEQQKAVMARAQQQQQQQHLARYTATPLNQQQPSPPPHHLPQQYVYPEAAGLFGAEVYNAPDMFSGAPTWSQKAIAVTPPSSAHGMKPATNAQTFANAANSAFLSGSPYGGSPLGMFKPTVGGVRSSSVNGEDDNSSVGEGSSHFSSTSDLGMISASPVDHPFAYGVNPGNMMGLGFGMPMNMNGLNLGISMPPSPPHSVSLSPAHSQPQSRRQSVAVSAF